VAARAGVEPALGLLYEKVGPDFYKRPTANLLLVHGIAFEEPVEPEFECPKK